MNKKEQIEIEESLSEDNIGEHKLQTTPTDHSMALQGQFKGMDIEGLEDVPASMVAVPFCRVIQPSSKKTELKNGKEAVVGNFMFNDIQEEIGELNFTLLRAKAEQVRVDTGGNYVTADYEGETRIKPVLKLLGVTLDTEKLFILTITSTSFSSWGKLMAQFKAMHVDKSWRFGIKAVTEKRENKKGKFYVVNFQLDKELTKEQFESASEKAAEYGVTLDSQLVSDEE